jgi:menaquinone-dependent protoporphyrinogen oxidase
VETRILVVVASRFGSTRAIADRIAAVMAAGGLAVDLRTAEEADDPGDLDGYGAFVIGSTVEAGHWLPAATGFVRRNKATIAARPVWLFSSGPLGDRAVLAPQPDPKEVAEFRRTLAPRDHRFFAGAYDRATADFSGMGLAERTLVRRMMPSGDWRDWPAIEAWAREIARRLVPMTA